MEERFIPHWFQTSTGWMERTRRRKWKSVTSTSSPTTANSCLLNKKKNVHQIGTHVHSELPLFCFSKFFPCLVGFLLVVFPVFVFPQTKTNLLRNEFYNCFSRFCWFVSIQVWTGHPYHSTTSPILGSHFSFFCWFFWWFFARPRWSIASIASIASALRRTLTTNTIPTPTFTFTRATVIEMIAHTNFYTEHQWRIKSSGINLNRSPKYWLGAIRGSIGFRPTELVLELGRVDRFQLEQWFGTIVLVRPADWNNPWRSFIGFIHSFRITSLACNFIQTTQMEASNFKFPVKKELEKGRTTWTKEKKPVLRRELDVSSKCKATQITTNTTDQTHITHTQHGTKTTALPTWKQFTLYPPTMLGLVLLQLQTWFRPKASKKSRQLTEWTSYKKMERGRVRDGT